jgi:hypothetical protein
MKRAAPALLLSLLAALELGACSGGDTKPGASGDSGTSGAAGISGAAGTAGSPGDGGASGDASSTGAGGSTNATGTDGAAGGAGNTGASGTGGTAGVAGGAVDGSADVGAKTDVTPLSGTVKLMVLGSSNERGTCWRAFLWREFHTNNITNFDLVGQQNTGPDCSVPGYDKDLQAPEDGIIITNIPASTYAGWFKANTPQIALMHFGGADLLANMPVAGVMTAYSTILAQMRLANPNIVLLIAQHTPEGKPAIVTLNADIAKWATDNSTAQSPVIAVDLYTGILPSDQSDGVHLNLSGSQKVADRWYAALVPFLKP